VLGFRDRDSVSVSRRWPLVGRWLAGGSVESLVSAARIGLPDLQRRKTGDLVSRVASFWEAGNWG